MLSSRSSIKIQVFAGHWIDEVAHLTRDLILIGAIPRTGSIQPVVHRHAARAPIDHPTMLGDAFVSWAMPNLKRVRIGLQVAPREKKQVGIIITGNKNEPGHHAKTTAVSFFTLKAYVESILARLGIENKTQDTEHMHLTGVLEYQAKNKIVACIGTVNHALLKQFDIHQPVLFAELYLDPIYKNAFKAIVYEEPAKFPAVKRDLALLLDKATSYAQIEKVAFETEKQLLKEVNLFDVYEGDKIPAGKKSYAVSFTLLNAHATLTDKQIESSMAKLLKAFEKEFNASLR